MANEELEKLSSSLKQMQDKFTSDWAGKIESQIDLKATKHREILETGRGTITTLDEKIAHYNDESNRKLEVLRQQTEEVSLLEKQLKELQLCASTLLEKKELEEKQLCEKERHLERMEKDIKSKEEATNYKLEQFTKGTAFFEDRLGLSFKKIDDHFLQFVFKYIDPNDCERAFFFSVSVGDDKQYTVKDCMPAVDGLDAMVEELNQKDNFSKFVINMRKKFKQTLP